ncbi:hypothetical protein Tco_1505461 [Tanacetum coccineum]
MDSLITNLYRGTTRLSVNDTLTVELERYKEQVKVLKEGHSVEIKGQNNFSDSHEQNAEIDHLKQTLSDQLGEKESLMKTINALKEDFKKEESRNIDREIALEKKIKHLDNIVYKRGQSAQTVHMLTKSKIFYDHSTKQAIGFQNPFYLKKAQQLEPKLYDGDVIPNTYTIEIPDSEETLMLAEESRSKMLLKQQDPMVLEKKVNTKPVDYVALNKLSQDFDKRFVPQTELSAEQAFWSQNSVPPSDPSPSSTTNKVEVPKELPKVSMVNTSLKRLKQHLAGFDKVVKERTTATTITEGTWGFEHTKACFRDEIIPFIKALKDIFNKFDQDLIDELTEVQTVFIQMEQAVEQHRLESKTFEVKMNQALNENDRLLEQVVNKDVVNVVILLENFMLNQSAPDIDQYFELNELKAQSQEKDKVILKLKEKVKTLSGNVNVDKVKIDMDEIETLNIELDHRVSKLITKNEHLKQTYKQLYDSIKPTREQGLVIIALKNELRKLKGKALDDNVVTARSTDPTMLKIDMKPITPRLYTKLIQELLKHINKTCLSINIFGEQLVVVTLKNKDKKVRFAEPVTSSANINTKTDSSSNLASNKHVLSSTGVRQSTSTSGSQPSGNTKKDRIQRPQSSNMKNKVEVHPRKVKSSLNNKNCVVKLNESANEQHSKLNANSKSICVTPTSRTFTIVGNACPLTRITTTTEVPPRKPINIEYETPKPVVTLVYSRKPRKSKSTDPVSKPKIIKSANTKEPSKSWGSTVSNVPSSSLDDCRLSKLFSGIWTLAASSI